MPNALALASPSSGQVGAILTDENAPCIVRIARMRMHRIRCERAAEPIIAPMDDIKQKAAGARPEDEACPTRARCCPPKPTR